MASLKKINWIITWLSLIILKQVTRKRFSGNADRFWIQTPNKNVINIYNRIDFILNYCKNKNILHVGCTDSPFTTQKLENKSLLHTSLKQVATVTGIDNNKISIKEYKSLTGDNDIYYSDIMESYPPEISPADYNIILVSEVLEHLKDPATAINIIYDTFNSGTEVLVTVPNYAAVDTIAASLNKTESTHPDHYWYFSPYTLCRLFDKDKFELQQLHFGMYYKKHTSINRIMKQFPFNGDCIIAIFSIKK